MESHFRATKAHKGVSNNSTYLPKCTEKSTQIQTIRQEYEKYKKVTQKETLKRYFGWRSA